MERKEVKEKYKWKTEDIFKCDEEWEACYDETFADIGFSRFSGKLGDKSALLEYLKFNDKVLKDLEVLAVYANLKHDEDSRVAKYNAYNAKIGMLFSKYCADTSFFEPEMAKQSEEYLKSLVCDNSFSDYDYRIKRIIDGKKHVPSAEQERLIGMLGETFDSFSDIFGMINNVDLPLPEVELDGDKVKLTHGLYGATMNSHNREKRREVYENYYSAFKNLIHTITSNYYGNVKKNVFLCKAYNFSSCLERALFEEDVNKCVYENLLQSVNKNLPVLHRYVQDRKKILGYDKLYFYDINAPLVQDVDFKMPYDKAYEYVMRGLAPLGEEYIALLKRGYEERWIDVEETTGKRSGAYSASCPGIHPFVLLNYQPTINEVFTIAHEMGHSIHTHFSAKNQPFSKSNYTIFVAEVASTVNEVLLLKYMLAEAENDKLKKYLLNYYLDTIRATLHRQTMFAEFEYEVHNLAEHNEPLTTERICEIYAELGKKYYGDAIEHDYNISCEWCRVPHFYNAFYVYKYATGITAAINIAKRILSEGDRAVKDYFNFLSGGSSSDPVSLLKLAGVNLESEQPFEVAMKEFKQTLNEFEHLMGI